MTEIPTTSTVDIAEISRFSALSEEWWDPKGPMRPLHAMNPLRVRYIRDRLGSNHIIDDPTQIPASTHRTPLAGLDLADIGCGGGILSEPMARLGAKVTGIDASPENIGIAMKHASETGCMIDYRCTSVEDLAEQDCQFDVVTALEIVEHVANLADFIQACVEITKPDGDLFFSTLNRTAKSYAVAIVGAERILRLVPDGTHEYSKFVKPGEMRRYLRAAGAELIDCQGMTFSLKEMDWQLSRNMDVNYILHARKLSA